MVMIDNDYLISILLALDKAQGFLDHWDSVLYLEDIDYTTTKIFRVLAWADQELIVWSQMKSTQTICQVHFGEERTA